MSGLFENKRVSPLYFIGLFFLWFPLYYAQFYPHTWLIIVSTLCFACAYVSILFTSHKIYTLLVWCYMIAYIIYTSMWLNIQFSLFLFNLSSLLSWYFPNDKWTYKTISYGATLGAIIIYTLLLVNVLEVKIFVIILQLFGVSLLIGTRFEARREAMTQKLQEQNQSINLLLAENERNRIGQDLHDTLGHVFAMLSVKAELVSTLLDREQVEQAKKEVTDLQLLAKQSMSDVRRIVQSIQQHTIREECHILQQMLELANVTFSIKGLANVDVLPLDVQAKLAMILRELANNLVKHAKAKRCELDFSYEKSVLKLVYVDDGVGFDELDGTELRVIKDRLVTIKGELLFQSLKQPTQLVIQVPRKEENG